MVVAYFPVPPVACDSKYAKIESALTRRLPRFVPGLLSEAVLNAPNLRRVYKVALLTLRVSQASSTDTHAGFVSDNDNDIVFPCCGPDQRSSLFLSYRTESPIREAFYFGPATTIMD